MEDLVGISFMLVSFPLFGRHSEASPHQTDVFSFFFMYDSTIFSVHFFSLPTSHTKNRSATPSPEAVAAGGSAGVRPARRGRGDRGGRDGGVGRGCTFPTGEELQYTSAYVVFCLLHLPSSLFCNFISTLSFHIFSYPLICRCIHF